MSKNIELARQKALIILKKKRIEYLNSVKNRNLHLKELLNDRNIAKIVVAILYLGEGTKNIKRASLTFANSDSNVIELYLRLLRYCYSIDESRFRCTLQCRADQDIPALESFWSRITQIPLSQFYKARVDARSVGKISKKKEYKGVCRIDYFSADVFLEISKIIETLMGL